MKILVSLDTIIPETKWEEKDILLKIGRVRIGFALKASFAPKVWDLHLKSDWNGTLGAKLFDEKV